MHMNDSVYVCVHEASTRMSMHVCTCIHVYASVSLCVEEGNKTEGLNWVQVAEMIQAPSKKNGIF